MANNPNNFSSRFKQFAQRLKDTTQLPIKFGGEASSEGQSLSKDLAEVADILGQFSQVMMEVEVLNQLHSRALYERDALQQEKADLEARVFEYQQERNELEPQVIYLRDQYSQASLQLEQTQNRERNLSDRERQLTEIVSQLERRRAVLNQAIETLTNQEADYIVRTQELSQIIADKEKKAKDYISTVSSYKAYLEELKAQVAEAEDRLKELGTQPKAFDLHPEPEPEPDPVISAPPPPTPASQNYWDEPPPQNQSGYPPYPANPDTSWGNPWN